MSNGGFVIDVNAVKEWRKMWKRQQTWLWRLRFRLWMWIGSLLWL